MSQAVESYMAVHWLELLSSISKYRQVSSFVWVNSYFFQLHMSEVKSNWRDGGFYFWNQSDRLNLGNLRNDPSQMNMNFTFTQAKRFRRDSSGEDDIEEEDSCEEELSGDLKFSREFNSL